MQPAQEAGERSDRSRNIVRGLGSLTAQSALSAVLGFVLFFSLVRFLPQSLYGTYAAVQVTVGIAGTFAGFGLSLAVVRHLAPGSSGQSGEGWGEAKAALLLVVALSGAASAALVGLAPYLSVYFSKSPSSAWVFELGGLWLFTISLASPMQSLLQGMRRYGILAKVLLVSRLIAVAVAVAGVALYQSLAVAVVSQGLYGALIVISILPLVLGPLRKADPRPHFRTVTRYAFPLGLAGIVSMIAGSADIVVVGGRVSAEGLPLHRRLPGRPVQAG